MSIGATIRFGAGSHTMTMQGNRWDLAGFTRNQLGALAGLLVDTMGLTPKHTHKGPRRARNRKEKSA